MPTVYLNGSTPDYIGYVFTSPTNLLDQIDITLTAAGWLTISKTPAVNLLAKGTTNNGHNCWVEFIVSGVSPALTLTLRGWLEESKTNGSPDATHTITFQEGADNRLWLTADNDAGCICIYNPSSGASSGYHFGFLQRIDPTDPWAWMIGRIHSNAYAQAYVAKAKHANTIWKQLGADFQSGANFEVASVSLAAPAPYGCIDFCGRITNLGGQSTSGNEINNPAVLNAAYRIQDGRRNYNGQAVIDAYHYMEGRNSVTAYGSTSALLYFRGFVKFAHCGVASELACSQCVDPLTGNRILSVGGTQWQGMRIL